MKCYIYVFNICKAIAVVTLIYSANRTFKFSQETDDAILNHLRLISSAIWTVGAAIVTFLPWERKEE